MPTIDYDEPFTAIAPDGLLRVCAWHTPRPRLDALNRLLPGRVSHSICEKCQQRVFAEAGA